VIRALRTFGLFWYDFLVGDDWTIAIAVVASVGLTVVAANRDLDAWWLMMIAVGVVLTLSVLRAAKPRSQ